MRQPCGRSKTTLLKHLCNSIEYRHTDIIKADTYIRCRLLYMPYYPQLLLLIILMELYYRFYSLTEDIEREVFVR